MKPGSIERRRSLPAKAPSKTAARKDPGPGEVRLIGGQWKRTRLRVLDLPGLRPTPDRVRETLFNWLGQDLSGWRCVDVFAGTGALGLEAASRGAREVLLWEQQAGLVAQLQKVQAQLQAQNLKILRTEGVSALAQLAPGSMDLVLLDPPFASELFTAALAGAARAVTTTGFIYLEAPRAWNASELRVLGLDLHRHLKAGVVHAHLLRRLPASAA